MGKESRHICTPGALIKETNLFATFKCEGCTKTIKIMKVFKAPKDLGR